MKSIYEIIDHGTSQMFTSDDGSLYIAGFATDKDYFIEECKTCTELKELTFKCVSRSCENTCNDIDDKSLDTLASIVISFIKGCHGAYYVIYDEDKHYKEIFDKLYKRLHSSETNLGVVLKSNPVEDVETKIIKRSPYYLMYDKTCLNARQMVEDLNRCLACEENESSFEILP